MPPSSCTCLPGVCHAFGEFDYGSRCERREQIKRNEKIAQQLVAEAKRANAEMNATNQFVTQISAVG